MPGIVPSIHLDPTQADILYAAGDDLNITISVKEDIGAGPAAIIWGAATAVGQVREEAAQATIDTTFDNVLVNVNGQMTLTMTATKTWTLLGKTFRYSVQVTRGGIKRTYLAGYLRPAIEATHP